MILVCDRPRGGPPTIVDGGANPLAQKRDERAPARLVGGRAMYEHDIGAMSSGPNCACRGYHDV